MLALKDTGEEWSICKCWLELVGNDWDALNRLYGGSMSAERHVFAHRILVAKSLVCKQAPEHKPGLMDSLEKKVCLFAQVFLANCIL